VDAVLLIVNVATQCLEPEAGLLGVGPRFFMQTVVLTTKK
jgi:hypothetical protein